MKETRPRGARAGGCGNQITAGHDDATIHERVRISKPNRPAMRGATMNYDAVKFALEHGPDDKSDAFVLIALCSFANSTTLRSWPSVQSLSLYARSSERQVRRSLRNLEAKGFIRRISPGSGGHSKTTIYQIIAKKPGHGDRVNEPEPGHHVRVVRQEPGHCVQEPGHHVQEPGHHVPQLNEDKMNIRSRAMSKSERKLAAFIRGARGPEPDVTQRPTAERAAQIMREAGYRVAMPSDKKAE